MSVRFRTLYTGLICLGLAATATFSQGNSGIPAIDSLPRQDWGQPSQPLSYGKALAYSLLIPGGGQIYAGHPVRAGFLIGLEGLLLSQGIYANNLLLETKDREIRARLDSADALYESMVRNPESISSLQNIRYDQITRARRSLDAKVKQQDLANSQIAWGLGLHFYGIMDAMESVYRSREDDRRSRSLSRALWYGLAFPGGGQLYNRRYGKFGMLWMALGSSVVSAVSRQNVVDYLQERREVLQSEEGLPFAEQGRIGVSAEIGNLEQDLILYRKRRNQYYWGLALFYTYAIVDGMVDAALSDFDHPKRFALEPGAVPYSLQLSLKF